MEILEFIKKEIPASVSLICVHYNDQLDKEQLSTVNHLLNKGQDYDAFESDLYNELTEFIQNSTDYSVADIESTLRNSLIKEYSEEVASDVMDAQADFINETIHERDCSTPVSDLIGNTPEQCVRIEMHTNEEGLDGAYHFQDYAAYEGYFKDIIDKLYLNPKKVKEMLVDKEFTCHGSWPNRSYREGKEYVSYESFYQEIINTTSNCNRLTFVGKLDLSDLENYAGKITIPAGNDCGLFDSVLGAGGLMEMKLLRPITIKLGQYGDTEYDSFVASIDKTKGYSIDEVYCPSCDFWGKNVSFK